MGISNMKVKNIVQRLIINDTYEIVDIWNLAVFYLQK